MEVTGWERAKTLCVPPLVAGTDVTVLASHELDVTVTNVGTACAGGGPLLEGEPAAAVMAAARAGLGLVGVGGPVGREGGGDAAPVHLASLPPEEEEEEERSPCGC